MKRLLIVLAATLVLGSCYWAPQMGDYSGITFPIPDLGLETVEEVVLWTALNISYAQDSNGEYWQDPLQTYERGQGDCEDFTLLAMYLVYRDTGLEPRMVAGYNAVGGHAWIYVEGNYWEPQRGNKVNSYAQEYHDIRYIDYGEAMYRAVETHRSVLDG